MSSRRLFQTIHTEWKGCQALPGCVLVNGENRAGIIWPALSCCHTMACTMCICVCVRAFFERFLCSLTHTFQWKHCTKIRDTIGGARKGDRRWSFLEQPMSSKCLTALLGMRQSRIPRAENNIVDKRYRCFGAVPCLGLVISNQLNHFASLSTNLIGNAASKLRLRSAHRWSTWSLTGYFWNYISRLLVCSLIGF